MTTTPTAPDAALLPCPFCGGAALLTWHATDCFAARCTDCCAEGPLPANDTEAEAITAWNRRAGQSHADAALLAALEECVTVLTAETIGTIYEDDPEWYAAIDRAVPRARAAIAAAKGVDQ